MSFLFLILPLFSALLAYFLKPSKGKKALLLSSFAAQLALGAAAVFKTYSGELLTAHAGGWPAPFGIVFVIDALSAGMLAAVGALFFASIGCSLFNEKFSPLQLSLIFFLQAGANLSLITGDLFNLFVAFEMMLAASYGLMTLVGEASKRGSAYLYLIVGILGSFLFLTIVALAYGSLGSLNMGQLSLVLQEPANSRVALALACLGLIVYGIKAGLFPLYFWLPDSYPTLTGPTLGLFSGVLTKVAVYVLLRLFITILPHELEGMHLLLLAVGEMTMLFGVLGALSRTTISGILCYHIVSQIGYMAMGLGLFSAKAVSAALIFLWHNMFVKASLLLFGVEVKRVAGSDHLKRIGGLWGLLPLSGSLFLLQALSLAGLPPLSGFWGKYLLFFEGLRLGRPFAVAVALLTSFLTLLSMMKIWSLGYWGERRAPRPFSAAAFSKAALALVLFSLAMAAAIEPLVRFSDRAALDLFDRARYQREVSRSLGEAG